MAAAPQTPPVVALLEQLQDPLLLFNVAGNVTVANAAARALPGNLTQALSGHPDVRALVRDVALGKRQLPQELVLPLAGNARVAGRFVAGPTGADVAFLPARASTAGGTARAGGDDGQLPLRQIIELLRSELMPPVEELLQGLSSLPPSAPTSQLQRSALEVGDRLGRLADLVTVFGDDALVDDDRVVIPELVRRVCRELAPMAERQRVQFAFAGDEAELPPIYGSAKLLSRAFKECLDNAVRHARASVNVNERLTVQVRFTPSGQHLLVAMANRGAVRERLPALPRQPFALVLDEEHGALRIGLPLARRIVELHGGHIRIGEGGDDTVQVLMELPTGAPRRGSNRLDIAQAQRYAADLAKLMSRQRRTA